MATTPLAKQENAITQHRKNPSIVLYALGKKIKNARAAKTMSLAQLAQLCDMSPILLYEIETGFIDPSFLTLLKICKFVNVTMEELVK